MNYPKPLPIEYHNYCQKSIKHRI